MDRAFQLINELKTKPSKREKDSALAALLQHALVDRREIADAIQPSVLELQHESSPLVRASVIRFVEECGRAQPQSLPSLVDPIRDLLEDSAVLVKRRAILATTLLYRPAANLVSQHPRVPPRIKSMWDTIVSTRSRILQLLDDPPYTTQVIKFVEMLALAHSQPPEDEAEAAPNPLEFNLSYVPNFHALLNPGVLRREADGSIALLVARLRSTLSVPTLLVLVNGLAQACTHRPQFCPLIIPALCDLHVKPPSLPPVHMPSFNSTLKSALLTISKIHAAGAHGQILITTLTSLGGGELCEHNLRAAARNIGKRGASSLTSPSKRLRATQGATQATFSLESLPMHLPLDRWHPDTLAEFVIYNMTFLPAQAPASFVQAPPLAPSTSPTEQTAPSSAAGDAAAVPTEAPVAEVEMTEAAPEPSEIEKSMTAKKTLPELKPQPLSAEAVALFFKLAVTRIQETEAWARQGGRHPLWTCLLARIVSFQEERAPLREDLVKFVLDEFHERLPLAAQWLIQQLANDLLGLNPEGSAKGSYEVTLTRFVTGVLAKQGSAVESDLPRLLAQAPMIPPATIDTLRECCQGAPKRRALGLSSMAALALARPPLREELLSSLLEYSCSGSEQLRTAAIETLTDELSIHAAVAPIIAARALAKVEEIGATPEDKLTDEGIRVNLLLFMALCAHNPEDQLPKLVEQYNGGHGKLRTALQNEITPVVQKLGSDHPALLALIASGTETSAALILQVLKIATEKQVTPGLVKTVKELHASQLPDSRLMVCLVPALTKGEVLQLLPALVALPQQWVKASILSILRTASLLAPAELMVALHQLQVSEDLPLRRILEAVQICFAERTIYHPQVLAVVLQQMVDISPLPILFMRTTLQTLKLSPRLAKFVLGILQRLIGKQIWTNNKLWEGFIKCLEETAPLSASVMLQLPEAPLEEVLLKSPKLAGPLAQHLKESNASVPQGILTIIQKHAGGDTEAATDKMDES